MPSGEDLFPFHSYVLLAVGSCYFILLYFIYFVLWLYTVSSYVTLTYICVKIVTWHGSSVVHGCKGYCVRSSGRVPTRALLLVRPLTMMMGSLIEIAGMIVYSFWCASDWYAECFICYCVDQLFVNLKVEQIRNDVISALYLYISKYDRFWKETLSRILLYWSYNFKTGGTTERW